MRRDNRPTHSPIRFPLAWTWFFDELIPGWVKDQYSPRESWKGKPFEKVDAKFFFKGIEELSELFTEERPKHIPAYFQHGKFRSAYLLYFLPLQAAKFLTVFQLHPKAFDAALEDASKKGVLRVADLGAGPGTASLALLMNLMEKGGALPPKIELHWFDTDRKIMDDGKKLIEQFANQFPKLRGRVEVKLISTPWWEAVRSMEKTSLTLMGHVLNEATIPHKSNPWPELIARSEGGGILMIEPAAKKTSQHLSQVRDKLFEEEVIEKEPHSIWGPCLHAGNCPLAEGRDWCHFSVPVDIPGNWFREFSKGLGSERLWVKFSYLWLATSAFPAEVLDKKMRRVISDPLTKTGQGTPSILICEPEQPGKITAPRGKKLRRGDLVKI